MKIMSHLLCLLLLAVCAGRSFAEGPAGDPLHSQLLPPELLMHHRAKIGLTDQQLEKIQALMEEAGPKAQQHQMHLREAMGKLTQLLAVEKVNKEAALKQFDKVLAIEKEVKRLHLGVMIQIRNALNAEQQKIAMKLQQHSQHAEGLQKRLEAKVSRIAQEVQRRAQAGQPPRDVVDLMQNLPQLLKQGQVKEAEALLDRVLKLLAPKNANKAGDKPKPAGSKSSRSQPQRDVKTLSPEAVRTEVAALKKENVAWRKIEWKTCLLDGLQASREQHKPIMLWIFIDRPIDDERC